MKILLVNNYYYNRGGDCTYLFSLKKLLEEKGHRVSIFSMHHPQNFDSEYSRYFVSYINYDEEIKNVSIYSSLKVLNRTIYSKEAKVKIEELIRDERPDIVHLQNIHHHITPSIFYIFKKYKVPVVWTLHDYTLICPNTSFLSHGKICERCKKKKYFWPSIVKCKKDSFGASSMAAFESTLHNLMKIDNYVDAFIAPSKFLYDKFLEYGIKSDKLMRLDHFTTFSCSCEKQTTGAYYLYVGRISEEKGLKTLIDAALRVNSSKLKIAGGGPMSEQMIEYTRSKDKNNIIEFLGHKSLEELIELYKDCKFIVVPSEWYEISGLIIFEAFACGKPAIGSKIGGITELIKDTERGLLFEPGNVEDLSATIKFLLNNPDIVEEMGNNAREFVVNELSAEKHYHKLIEIYEQAISKHIVSAS
jgi:glycosyltransferase involved in cell wall biosynthesis